MSERHSRFVTNDRFHKKLQSDKSDFLKYGSIKNELYEQLSTRILPETGSDLKSSQTWSIFMPVIREPWKDSLIVSRIPSWRLTQFKTLVNWSAVWESAFSTGMTTVDLLLRLWCPEIIWTTRRIRLKVNIRRRLAGRLPYTSDQTVWSLASKRVSVSRLLLQLPLTDPFRRGSLLHFPHCISAMFWAPHS